MTEPKYGNYLNIATNFLIVKCKTDDFGVEVGVEFCSYTSQMISIAFTL